MHRIAHRILALDLRRHRFGFAAFESPSHLLDTGVRRFMCLAMLRQRIAELIRLFAPEIIVVRRIGHGSRAHRKAICRVESAITREAMSHSAILKTVSTEDVRSTFSNSTRLSKAEIALHVTGKFPEIAWKLPPPKKRWMGERHNMVLFDAVAVGIAYWALSEPDDAPENAFIG